MHKRRERRRVAARSHARAPTARGCSTMRDTSTYDVLVIGAGPSGAATGYWLAERGHRVLVVEKEHFPRDKTCGDGLTPRAVRQLHDMGLAERLAPHPALRRAARDRATASPSRCPGPTTPTSRATATSCAAASSTQMVAEQRGEGRRHALAPVQSPRAHRGRGHRARRRRSTARPPAPTRRSGPATWSSPTAPTRRFGRALGTARDRDYPLGMAIRGYFTSPYHDEPWIESHLDIRDREGNHLPGYGWIFPVGDGTINVGCGLLSTFQGWKDINTTQLMDAFCATAPARWGIRPETSTGAPTGGRLPTGGSVVPHVGPNWLVVGDAAGRSIRSTARASPSPTRPAASPPTSCTRRSPATTGSRSQTYQERLDDDIWPVFQGRPHVRAVPSATRP